MSGAMLTVKNLTKHFGTVTALSNVSCSIEAGEIVGVIGPNGAGKTTLFNIISGFEKADRGQIALDGRSIIGRQPYQIARAGLGRTFQNLRLIRQMSVLDNVLLSLRDQPGEKLKDVFFARAKYRVADTENANTVLHLLEEVGLSGKAHVEAGELSFGQQKLLSVICAFAGARSVLLLDEPVAGVAPQMTDIILKDIRKAADSGRAVFVIEHNIDVVVSLCSRVIFLAAGIKVCEGTPEEVRRDPRVIDAYLGASHVA